MNAYQSALERFLDRTDIRQDDVAEKAGLSQAAINRYAKGKRFPNADRAKLIAKATDNAVSFELWQTVAAEKFGIAA
jgi:transcriptional regulator with XRE-family HTH domain